MKTPKLPVILSLIAATAPVLAASSWWTQKETGVRRYSPTATALADGRVLVAGGYNGSQTVTSAQLFNPTSDSFSSTGSLGQGRNFAAAARLGSGAVLVAGGYNSSWGSLDSAELYNPGTGKFSKLRARMASRRELFTMTPLPNGKLLLAGGFKTGFGGGTLRSAELYDPATQKFTATGSMQAPYGRFGHAALRLPDGKVLIAGGKERRSSSDWRSLSSAEIYDPATGTFTAVAAGMAYRRDRPALVWVESAGKALVIGGKTEAPGEPTDDVLETEWFDPATGAFTPGPAMMAWQGTPETQPGRMAHTVTPLPGGEFLVSGGWSVRLNRTTESAERFVPDSSLPLGGSFVSAGTMWDHRHDAAAEALPDGRVLIVGGKKVDQNPGGTTEYLSRAELYTP